MNENADDTLGNSRGPALGPAPILADNLRVLDEAAALLRGLPPGVYGDLSGVVVSAPIGAHLRHVLDHFGGLLDGLDSGLIDYDTRPRDPRVERDPDFALATIAAISARLLRLDALDRPLQIVYNAGPYAEDPQPPHGSTLRRELHFAMMHAVHHYTCISIELRARGLPTPPDLGIAPATLRFRRSGG